MSREEVDAKGSKTFQNKFFPMRRREVKRGKERKKEEKKKKKKRNKRNEISGWLIFYVYIEFRKRFFSVQPKTRLVRQVLAALEAKH